MKLLVMLAAIYALIINQSLKQKERKAELRVAPTSKDDNIKVDNNVYLNASFRSNAGSANSENGNRSNNNGKIPDNSSYRHHPFHSANTNAGDEMLYPLNFYYTPVDGNEGSR